MNETIQQSGNEYCGAGTAFLGREEEMLRRQAGEHRLHKRLSLAACGCVFLLIAFFAGFAARSGDQILFASSPFSIGLLTMFANYHFHYSHIYGQSLSELSIAFLRYHEALTAASLAKEPVARCNQRQEALKTLALRMQEIFERENQALRAAKFEMPFKRRKTEAVGAVG